MSLTQKTMIWWHNQVSRRFGRYSFYQNMSILEKKLMGVESLLSKYFLAQWNHDYDFLKFILINPVKSLAKSRCLLSCVLYQSSRSENGQWQPVMLHSNDLFCIVCSIAAQTMAKKVKYLSLFVSIQGTHFIKQPEAFRSMIYF